MSGGLDSTVVLHMVLEKQVPVRAICFNYGQEAIKETEYARKTCEKLKVPFELLDISNLGLAGNLGKHNENELDTETLVPNRNAMFLSIATSYAIKHGCNYIYYGATGHTHPSFLDTQPEFVIKFNEMNLVSDIHPVQVKAPLIFTDDYDILELALEYGVDLTETWTCYNNTEKPCGVCDRCKAKQKLSLEFWKDLQDKEDNVAKQLVSYDSKIPEVKEVFDGINPEDYDY